MQDYKVHDDEVWKQIKRKARGKSHTRQVGEAMLFASNCCSVWIEQGGCHGS